MGTTAKNRKVMQDVSYNGWSNHATWCVNLWLENDYDSYLYWRAEATLRRQDHPRSKPDAASALATQLKDEFEYAKPDLGATVWADLLQSSFSDVDWYEIAKSWIDGL